MTNNKNKSVIFIIPATGFSREQYKPTKEELEDSGISVLTVSDVHGDAIAKEEFRTRVDMTFDEVDMENYDGVVYFGGPGAELYLNNKACYDIARSANKLDKVVGAIQVTPRILARSGVLSGHEATGWNEDSKLKQIFEQADVEYNQEDVVVDGNIVTAKDEDSATKFAHSIMVQLNNLY